MRILKASAIPVILLLSFGLAPCLAAGMERWGVFEAEFRGPSSGNPFVDVTISAVFAHGGREIRAPGFYDGDGIYRIRFMPDELGEWTYTTESNRSELSGKTGAFACSNPPAGNHGPVRVRDTFHFAYADGTPFFPFGTTAYAWIHQGVELEAQTLATLKTAGFNKIRMCVFPKDYSYNKNEPVFYPFEREGDGSWIFDRFNPSFWHHLEERLTQLSALGIEADLILWHPYDRWGHSRMDAGSDLRYLRYAIARLAAHRNVWWSLANEYDFMLKRKPMELWDRFFETLANEDPHQHLRSIHNGNIEAIYDHTHLWVTHVSLQHYDVQRIREWRKRYQKPVVNDECEYEGDIPHPWGNISARELVHRFWVMVTGGGYATHGETYEDADDILWWSKGGVLHGESAARIAFLRKIAEERAEGYTPMEDSWVWTRVSGARRESEWLFYFGPHQPLSWIAGLPKQGRYTIDVIDTWSMTIERLPGTFTAPFSLPLPGKPYMAARVLLSAEE